MFGVKSFSRTVCEDSSSDESMEMTTLSRSIKDKPNEEETSFKTPVHHPFRKKDVPRKEVTPFKPDQDLPEEDDIFGEFSPSQILRKEFFEGISKGKNEGDRLTGIRQERDPEEPKADPVATFSCPQCLYATRVKENLCRHRRIHDPGVEWHQCPRCPFRTARKPALENHLEAIHSEAVEWHQCPLCPLRTTRPVSLKDHIQMIHDPKAQWFNCNFCLFKSTAKKRLDNHLWSKHRLVQIENN